jgi:hypothetical protein
MSIIKNRTPRDPLTPVEAARQQQSRRRLSILAVLSIAVLIVRQYRRSARPWHA